MFEEKELLAVRSDYVNAEGQWNETFIKTHAEARLAINCLLPSHPTLHSCHV